MMYGIYFAYFLI